MREAIAIYAKLYFDADAAAPLPDQAREAESELWSLVTAETGAPHGFTSSAVLAAASEAEDRDSGGRPPFTARGFHSFDVARVGEWKGSHCALIGWQWCKPGAEPGGPDSTFWTVYGRDAEGLAQAVGDFTTRGRALAMAEALADGRAVTVSDSTLPPFYLSWETVTDESAEHGDADARGYMRPLRYSARFGIMGAEPVPLNRVPRYRSAERYGFPLRDALAALREPMRPDGNPHGGSLSEIEASDSDVTAARWISCHYGRDPETGAFLSLSLHFPETVSGSSRARILRLLRS